MTTWNEYIKAHHNYIYLDEGDAHAFRMLALLNHAPIAPGVVAAMLNCTVWAAQKCLERLVDKKLLRIDDRGLYYLPLRVRDLAQQQLESLEPLNVQREVRQRAIQWYSSLSSRDLFDAASSSDNPSGETQDIALLPPPPHAS